MKILVTGAAGFIGSHLCERLAKEGHDVIGVDCFTDYYHRQRKEMNAADVQTAGVHFVEADIATTNLAPLLQGVEIIYHLAAQPGISAHVSMAEYVRNNILATHQLLEAAKAAGSVKLFINTGTSSIYGLRATDPETAEVKPISYYGVTKLAAEQLALTYSRTEQLPACSLRLFSVYGPRERPEKLYPKLIGSLLRDKAFPLYEGSLNHNRSYTYVDDAIEGFVSVLKHLDKMPGEIFNIGSNQTTTTAEVIKIVEGIIKKKTVFDHKPGRPGDQKYTHTNIDKARAVLGYNPKTLPQEGLTHAVAWYKNRILPNNLW